jgi:hypothetical protein
MFAITEFFAGLLPFILHIGIAAFLLLVCAAVVWFSSSLKTKAATILLALLIICGMVCYLVGAHNERQRCDAQAAALNTEVNTIVERAPTEVKPHKSLFHPSRGVRYDKWDSN